MADRQQDSNGGEEATPELVKPSNTSPIKPPEEADPEKKTNIPKPESYPSTEDAETMEIVRKRLHDTQIKPYVEPPFNVNDHPRLKSIQSRIDSITSQISYAESNLPDGGAFFTDEFLGTVLGETERRTQYTVDEQRRDHAEARIQDLYGKKSDLKMQYELEQEKISIAYVAEYERKRASYYRKEIERVGGTPEQVKSLKTAYGIE